MGYIEDLINDQNDPLFEHHIEPPERTETQAIVSDSFDKMTWEVLQTQAIQPDVGQSSNGELLTHRPKLNHRP